MSEEAKKIEQILGGHSPQVVTLVTSLRRLVQTAAPELREEAKTGWGNITYKKNGVVCAISPHKKHVNLNFYKGTSLPDPAGVLEGTGKELRHVKIRKPEDIRADVLTRLLQEAVRLDAGK